MKKIFIYNLAVILSFGSLLAQQTPAKKQVSDYSVVGAKAHLGNGKTIENALIQFSGGKITFVGDATLVKRALTGTVINAEGKHVYPGFIALNTTLGLGEVDAVKASRDEREIGTLNPHIRSLIAYNAESKVIESMRPNGVLTAQITPRGGRISGTSSVVQLDAWNWEDAVIKVDDAIHVNWPSSISYSGRWWAGEPRVVKPSKNYVKNLAAFSAYIKQAKAYLNGNSAEKHLPFESMKGLFNGSQKLFIHVNGEREITDAISIVKKLGINKIVIVHGNGAEKITDLLVNNNISVVLDRAHRLPNAEDQDYDAPYRSAKMLVEKGVVVGIGMEGNMERMSTRNIPFYAGTYAAYGLDKEKALELITGNAAKILGIDATTGTLEVGKDATLIISEGDALDMRTNKLTHAFIQGRKISLETHQTKLWKRYSNKYKNQ